VRPHYQTPIASRDRRLFKKSQKATVGCSKIKDDLSTPDTLRPVWRILASRSLAAPNFEKCFRYI